MRITLATLMVLGLNAAPAMAQTAVPQGADRIALGRKYILWLYTGAADSLWAAMSPEMQQDGSVADIQTRADELVARVGTETEVVSEKVVKRNGAWQYWRTAKYSGFPEPVMIRFVIADDGKITGIGSNPASRQPPVDPDSPPPGR